MPIKDEEIQGCKLWVDGKEITMPIQEIELPKFEFKEITDASMIKYEADFYFTTLDPRKILKVGMAVPFWYLIWWHHTYGCNNWRKRNGLPMLRKGRGRKRR